LDRRITASRLSSQTTEKGCVHRALLHNLIEFLGSGSRTKKCRKSPGRPVKQIHELKMKQFREIRANLWCSDKILPAGAMESTLVAL
jgi:hypothetical protein